MSWTRGNSSYLPAYLCFHGNASLSQHGRNVITSQGSGKSISFIFLFHFQDLAIHCPWLVFFVLFSKLQVVVYTSSLPRKCHFVAKNAMDHAELTAEFPPTAVTGLLSHPIRRRTKHVQVFQFRIVSVFKCKSKDRYENERFIADDIKLLMAFRGGNDLWHQTPSWWSYNSVFISSRREMGTSYMLSNFVVTIVFLLLLLKV